MFTFFGANNSVTTERPACCLKRKKHESEVQIDVPPGMLLSTKLATKQGLSVLGLNSALNVRKPR